MCLSLETLTSIIRTGSTILVELIDLVNSGDCHSPVLFDLFISSDASIYFTMAFPPLGNSDHVVLVSIDFSTNSKRNASFNRINYGYSCADWDGLCYHLKDVL